MIGGTEKQITLNAYFHYFVIGLEVGRVKIKLKLQCYENGSKQGKI